MNTQLRIMDSHAHLNSEDFPMDVEGAVIRAKASFVAKIINICTNSNELEKGLLLEQTYPDLIKNAAATTPHDAASYVDENFEAIKKAALEKKIIAIGETGFDDFIIPDNKAFQRVYCRRYIDLGIKTNLPVIFHVRGDEAFKELFELAKEFPAFTGIIHCFTGTVKQAEEALALGWYLSISGIVTFKKSIELQNVVREIPLDKLLIETDSPWLAPQGFRGKPNEPSYIKRTAEMIALLHNQTFEQVAYQTFENGCKVFNL